MNEHAPPSPPPPAAPAVDAYERGRAHATESAVQTLQIAAAQADPAFAEVLIAAVDLILATARLDRLLRASHA